MLFITLFLCSLQWYVAQQHKEDIVVFTMQQWLGELANMLRCRAHLEPDGTRWRAVGEVKEEHASGVGSQ